MKFPKRRSATPAKPGRWSIFKRLRPRVPRYFREAFSELKKVTWPGRREAWKMTLAVFIFSFVFALVVVAADFGLEIVAKELFL